MKISKLFHWLYAILMLLPAFAIGVTCAYAIFNKNAYQSQSNIDSVQYLKLQSNSNLIPETKYIVNYLDNENTHNYSSSRIAIYNNQSNFKEVFNINSNEQLLEIQFYNNDILYWLENYTDRVRNWYSIDTEFYFYSNSSISINSPTYITFTQETLIKGTLSDTFYYSIDKVQQSPLFNWAYDSFLATPITYITGLFGMATDHIAVMLMSYWLAISVIWLVFDMVMYVPLLVHRWIDKGVLE